MVVYWAENGMEEYQKTFSFVMNPHVDNEEQLQRIFDSLKKSRYVDVDNVKMDFEQSFYILCLDRMLRGYLFVSFIKTHLVIF